MKNGNVLKAMCAAVVFVIGVSAPSCRAESGELMELCGAVKDFTHEAFELTKLKIRNIPTWAKENPWQALMVAPATSFWLFKKFPMLHAVVFTIGSFGVSHEIKKLREKEKAFEKGKDECSAFMKKIIENSSRITKKIPKKVTEMQNQDQENKPS